MNSYTTISVTPEMLERLRSLKRGGESYTDLFERLIDESGAETRAEAQADD